MSLLVVTPTLGSRPSIRKTILSVAYVGGGNVTHVLSGPKPRLQKYLAEFPWIQIHDDGGSLGVYDSLNSVLSSSKYSDYDYFAYINDDDFWLPGFASLICAISVDSSLDLVYGRVVFLANSRKPTIRLGAYTPRFLDCAVLFRSGIPAFTQQSLIVRTSLLVENGLFDTARPLTADSLMWLNLLRLNIKTSSFNVYSSVYDLRGQRLSTNAGLCSLDPDYSRIQLAPCSSEGLRALLIILLYRMVNVPVYLHRIFSRFPFFRRHADGRQSFLFS
jgi:hypothetical protein